MSTASPSQQSPSARRRQAHTAYSNISESSIGASSIGGGVGGGRHGHARHDSHGDRTNESSVFLSKGASSEGSLSMRRQNGALGSGPSSVILQGLSAADAHRVKQSMDIFPLRFKDAHDEHKFFLRVERAFAVRAQFLGYMTTVAIVVYIIFLMLCVSYRTFPTSGEKSRAVLATILAIVAVLSWVPTIASRFKSTRQYLEYSVYAFTSFSNAIFGLWFVLNALWEEDGNVLGIVQFQRTKIWVNVLFYSVPVWGGLMMDIVMATRVKSSFYAHIALLLIVTVCNLAQAGVFIRKARTSADIVPQQNAFLMISTISDSCFLVCIMALLFVGRWVLEFQERVEFLKRLRASEQIQKLKQANIKKRKKRAATVIEEILSLIERVLDNVDEVLIETNMPVLVEGSALLERCQKILTETDNLYSIHFKTGGNRGHEAGGPDDIEGTGVDRADAMEEQFLQLYAEGHTVGAGGGPGGLVRMPTKVRFGEVTGVEFDQGEASSRVAKDGFGAAAGGGHAAAIAAAAATAAAAGMTIKDPARFALAELHAPVRRTFRTYAEIHPSLGQSDASRIGVEWDLDILDMTKRHKWILLEVGATLLADKLGPVRASADTLYNYLVRLQRTYGDNPYHNASHGAQVAHATACLFRMLRMRDAADYAPLDELAVYLAALGHDAGHSGRNNQFYVAKGGTLALLYGDVAVLENAHCAIAFKCLEEPGCNLFAETSAEVFKTVRKRMVEMILATDMGQHFEFVSRFRLRRQAAGFNYLEDPDDKWMVAKMCIKMADLGHALVDWTQHLEWSMRVTEEFYQQGEEETQYGLPISPLCDRSQHQAGISKSQQGFIEFVVQPLVSQIEELQHGGNVGVECVRRLMYNRYKWEEWAKSGHAPEMPDFKCTRTDHHYTLRVLADLFAEGAEIVPIDEANGRQADPALADSALADDEQ